MKTTTVEKWIWALIYGGLLLLCLGLFLQRTGPELGWAAVATGGAVAVVGTLLIGLRSRMRNPE